MSKFARIEDGKVAEIVTLDTIDGRFHPSLVWVKCPTDTKEGFLYDGLLFSPAIVIPPSKEELNTPILAALATADLKIIRSVVEGDTVRIAAHNTAQADLRAQLK